MRVLVRSRREARVERSRRSEERCFQLRRVMKKAAAMRTRKRSSWPMERLLYSRALKESSKERMETRIAASAGPKPARAPSAQMMVKLRARGMAWRAGVLTVIRDAQTGRMAAQA